MATAREEAERLVAAALAAASFASRASRRTATGRDQQREERGPSLDDLAGLASLAARFLGGRQAPQAEPPLVEGTHHRIATGSAECCICPICRAIAAVRDPSPEFAERLASGASDLAAGLTSILRAFGEASPRGESHPVADLDAELESAPSELRHEGAWADHLPPAEDVLEAGELGVGSAGVGEVGAGGAEVEENDDDSPWPGWSDFGSVWQAATRVQDDRRPAGSAQPATKPVAKKAVAKKAVAKKAVAKKAVAKKAVAKKAVKTAPVASDSASSDPAPKKAVAKKAHSTGIGNAPYEATSPDARADAPRAKTQSAKKATAKKAAAKKAAAKNAAAKKARG